MWLWTNQSGNDAVTVGVRTSRTLFDRRARRGREWDDEKCVSGITGYKGIGPS